jgi:G2/mitotic-specific cyclin-B, other
MMNTEGLLLPTYGYMKAQPDVNEKMRAILVDWLIEVHYKFKLLPETLFITVNIIDRYLESKTIERKRLQLLGVTAMWIACKYEEIYAPELKDFVYITDNAYEQKDILKLEYEVLRTLEFNVTTPSSFRFLQRFTKMLQADSKSFNLAWYLIELPLIEYKMLKYKPSIISSAALYVAMKILKKELHWNDKMK